MKKIVLAIAFCFALVVSATATSQNNGPHNDGNHNNGNHDGGHQNIVNHNNGSHNNGNHNNLPPIGGSHNGGPKHGGGAGTPEPISALLILGGLGAAYGIKKIIKK